ncbi:MAG: 30S ribosomal protein S2 [Bacteroidetes bacterium]|nr:30S ribosomal protein S2 [Bacteroidia bacterium]PCH68674.1 MAG: 30S ribosomal protein S2 [Bacteroidota bacterium]
MVQTDHKELLDAGVHFGHLKRKWNPHMSPYIFMEKNGIYIIDLNKTKRKLDDATAALKQIAKSGKKILFVATKKQAKSIVKEEAKKVNMPFVTERWLGGMLTNFATVRKSIKKMISIDKLMADEATFNNIAKREKLILTRERTKLETLLGGFAQLNRLPAALFIVDIKREHIAVLEALKLNITTFAMVDTNSDPRKVDFAIPANDDASKSISYITGKITEAIAEGLSERQQNKDLEAKEQEEEKELEGTAEAATDQEIEATEENKGEENPEKEEKKKADTKDSKKTKAESTTKKKSAKAKTPKKEKESV